MDPIVSSSAVNAYSNNSNANAFNQRVGRDPQGNAVYESDNYKITVNTSSEITVLNKQSNETTHVWGDPHVDSTGATSFDFKETTTFVLADGTKLTIDTEPWGTGGATVASRVTITNGAYGVQMDGVSINNVQDEVSITEYADKGAMLDLVVNDGNLVFENDDGTGFLGIVPTYTTTTLNSFSAQQLTQAIMDQAEAASPGGMFDRTAVSSAAVLELVEEGYEGQSFLMAYLDKDAMDSIEKGDEPFDEVKTA